MTKRQINTRIAASIVLSGINNMYYNLRRHEFGLINKTRCCTLRRAKNTPTHSFVSRMVDRKQMCGKPGKGRHGTSHHAKAIYKYKIISSSRS